ncbi:gamma-glutamyl-gamma-aminobutyrate hydrolase family protein [Paenibacillus sp. MBLB4367]|uniref:gamma-glutamyl-gamma-aminobutyrate hydrolase family protein n=1 Tax=Paenibacillus sp. MBLB4367 TaxID=3384767 RepID=UPI003907FD2D
MKPIIAITPNYEDELATLKHAYADQIRKAGGIPVIVPFGLSEEDIAALSETANGLLLSGGADVDPGYFGERPHRELGRVTPERDRVEIILAREFVKREKAIFAICRGIQVLNVALGGSLYQDIATQCPNTHQHTQRAPRCHLSHNVKAVEGSLLHKIAGVSAFKVNSFHHQAVKEPAPGLRVTASSDDGIVEAVEGEKHPFLLGVQWHPEDTAGTDEVSRKLFEAFVEASRAESIRVEGNLERNT